MNTDGIGIFQAVFKKNLLESRGGMNLPTRDYVYQWLFAK